MVKRTLFAVLLVMLTIPIYSIAQPTTIVEKDGYSIPVYNFNSLESFLTTKSDTVFIINFWATWCMPCVEELPNFLKADSVFGKSKVEVILVSLDFKSKIESQLVPFLKKNNVKTKVVVLSDMNSNEWIPRVDAEWSGSIPATIIFNKNKRKFYEKQFTYNELQTAIKRFKN